MKKSRTPGVAVDPTLPGAGADADAATTHQGCDGDAAAARAPLKSSASGRDRGGADENKHGSA